MKELTIMGNQMGNGLSGVRMDRYGEKELIRMETE